MLSVAQAVCQETIWRQLALSANVVMIVGIQLSSQVLEQAVQVRLAVVQRLQLSSQIKAEDLIQQQS
jgi:hypothetical protein